ncbi:MAG: VWA domain-containing protein [Planctomycetes bacterium]|nr:VWA domain-containing protein [Planctomycetota bacterium]MCB9884257.1 VWA domain-containing protein [Planctomycetota bacterium]
MTPAAPPLALRLQGQDFALEPGRQYLLGAGDDCDLRLPGAGPQHARLRLHEEGVELEDLGSGHGTWIDGERVAGGVARVGASLRLGRDELQLVPDDGDARIVPDPAMRQQSRQRRVAIALAQTRQRAHDPTFAELMSEELRHAPWLGLSIAGHALLLLLLWLLLPAPDISGRAKATVDIDLSRQSTTAGEAMPDLPEVQQQESQPFEVTDPMDAEAAPDAVDTASVPDPTNRFVQTLGSNPRLARRSGSSAGGGVGDVARLGSGGFRKVVGELRQSGLEIVFVFDSTGSMTRTINETKATITEMLAVLRALVPDARIGLVTYRDRGAREDYVTRQVPLGLDYWQAVNFVQEVLAEGGGDRPEAVRDGLDAAFDQPWRAGARRVIVLAGDAPPHDNERTEVLRRVKAFAKDGRSFVHTLVTSPELAGDDTKAIFTAIADAGHGHCVPISNRDRILQQVLELAVGREFDQDLARVTAEVVASRDQVDTWSLDLARRGGDGLTRELLNQPVPAALLNALVRRPRRAVFEQLSALLAARDTPDHTRQAVAWVMQRALQLPMPPIDPVEPRKANPLVTERMRRAIARLPE